MFVIYLFSDVPSMATFSPWWLSVHGYLQSMVTFCPWLPSVHGDFLSISTFCPWWLYVHGYLLSIVTLSMATYCPWWLSIHGYLQSLATYQLWLPSLHGCLPYEGLPEIKSRKTCARLMFVESWLDNVAFPLVLLVYCSWMFWGRRGKGLSCSLFRRGHKRALFRRESKAWEGRGGGSHARNKESWKEKGREGYR